MQMWSVIALIQLCVSGSFCRHFLNNIEEDSWYPIEYSSEFSAEQPIEDETYKKSPFVSERRQYADPFQENDMEPNFYEEIDENKMVRITGYENKPAVRPTQKQVTTETSSTTAAPTTPDSHELSRTDSTDQTKPGNLTRKLQNEEDPLWFKINTRRRNNKNININHNSNVNVNSNHNSNSNTNVNINHNSNVNINSNHNSNTNINVNQNTFRPFYIGNFPKHWHMCGGYIIDNFSQLCCQGNPVNKQPFSMCCGSGLYNLITEDCVTGSPVAKKLPECGSSKTTYDAFKQFCYHGDVYAYEKYVECDGALYYV